MVSEQAKIGKFSSNFRLVTPSCRGARIGQEQFYFSVFYFFIFPPLLIVDQVPPIRRQELLFLLVLLKMHAIPEK